MRMVLLLIALCLAGHAAWAASPLQGHWRVDAPTIPDYVGTVLIDRDGRAIWDAADDRGRPASFRGYVARVDRPKVEITFTNGIRVTRAHCLIQSADLMHCHNLYGDGRTSDVFTLTRVGPGPVNLLRSD
jgi:hypothetical protein